jgi:hypothetical protein
VHPEIKYVKIDRYDTWSMDHTLADIILPMLKQLQKDYTNVVLELIFCRKHTFMNKDDIEEYLYLNDNFID